MDTNNWGLTQGTEPPMDTSDWRTQLQPDSRQRIVNKIMETLKKHLPFSGQEGLLELRKIAQRFEEKIYTDAISQPDYLRKISLKMLTMETKSQNNMNNNMPSNPGGRSNQSSDTGLMQRQVQNPGQSHPMPLPKQPQSRQQSLTQTNIPPQSNLSSAPNIGQPPMQNLGQNSNMQNMPGQNLVGTTINQNSNMQNMFTSSQRQIPGRQQVVSQQQPQNPQQYLYQQQQLLKHKIQHPHSLIQMQQQQPQQQQPQPQQNLLQPNQMQSNQQSVMQTSSVMQPSMIPTPSLSGLQQNQQSNNVQSSTQSMLQQHPLSVIRQQQNSMIHQQQTPITQQPILPSQQQLMGQQSNAANLQHSQLLGQQGGVGDMQQQQRLIGQQTNLTNLQQHQQQQQLLNQQNNLPNMHQQQLGSNVHGRQQQQLLGPHSGNPGLQTTQHSAHMSQPKVPMQQQSQQNTSHLLPSQVHLQQPQASQQQMMSQIQSQPSQMQQQLGLQQQPNSLPRDMQQRLQASGPLLQQKNVLDQQKQLYQSQRALPETSSTSLDSTAQTGQSSGGDWREEVYQKIKIMKETYLPELNEMYRKIAAKLQQHDSLPQQPKSEQLDRLKTFKSMLERLVLFLQVPKNNIMPGLKERLGSYEKQIISVINTNRPRKPLQPGQLPPPSMHSMAQPQSQLSQVSSHENQINSQLQPTNIQGSAMPQNNMSALQHNSMSGVSTAQQSKMIPMQPGASLDSGQGSHLNSLQQVPASSLQQTTVSAPQQTNMNPISSQGGVNVIQPNLNSLQSSSSMFQHSQLKQQQEQQMLQSQHLKQQFQQRQMMQRQQILQQQQQLHQPGKQQLHAQLPTHQTPQPHQMNDVNDMKLRQGMGVKSGVFQQHLSSGQRQAYPHQQVKQGSPFAVSSPQHLQTASPQISQHSSPQIDQQNLLPPLTKVGTPLQSTNSPCVIPTPSPPLAPSPIPVDSEKPISGVSSITTSNLGHQQTGGAAAPAQSLAIGTPGISASPLLAEFSGPDGAHGNALASTSGKSTVTEQPIERLIKVVNSMSAKALNAAVSDVGSVFSMVDRIAGSAPGNGSRAAVGEDLVAMTKCRLQARNVANQDGNNGTKRLRRYTTALPLNVASSGGSMNDSIKQFTAAEASDLESTATSRIKKQRIEANHALVEEIREINQRLIDTVVDVTDEDVDPTAAAVSGGAEGTFVKCSYSAVALSPSLKSQYASVHMSPIQPLWLLVPSNYPNCSPKILDKFPVESCKESEDMSAKVKSRFSISMRCLSQPTSLGDIARTWDICARKVISEHAQQSGGGSFSSKYGTWENCLSTAK